MCNAWIADPFGLVCSHAPKGLQDLYVPQWLLSIAFESIAVCISYEFEMQLALHLAQGYVCTGGIFHSSPIIKSTSCTFWETQLKYSIKTPQVFFWSFSGGWVFQEVQNLPTLWARITIRKHQWERALRPGLCLHAVHEQGSYTHSSRSDWDIEACSNGIGANHDSSLAVLDVTCAAALKLFYI